MPIVTRPNANAPPAKQLDLPLAIRHAPHIVREHGLVETHAYPLVSQGFPYWKTRRVPTSTAWRRYPELQLDSATAQVAIILDVDHPPQHWLNISLGSAFVRVPNWISSSKRGHGHVVYTLAQPVILAPVGRRRPLQKLARVAEYYAAVYDADRAYAATLTHNPVHPRYADATTWLRELPYRLDELAEAIPAGWRIPSKPRTAEGRNCSLFMAAMRHFGKRENLDDGCHSENVQEWIEAAFERWYADNRTGWHPNENKWIADSVSSYCRRNREQPRLTPHFRERQAAKGELSGIARRKGSIEAKQPWVALGISRRTWYRNQGTPAPKLSELRPWELLGISRPTWYRRRKVGLL